MLRILILICFLLWGCSSPKQQQEKNQASLAKIKNDSDFMGVEKIAEQTDMTQVPIVQTGREQVQSGMVAVQDRIIPVNTFRNILENDTFHEESQSIGNLTASFAEHNNSIRETRHFVEVTVNNQVAMTKVTQVFTNYANVDLEATYRFRLPQGAKIHSFAMWVRGKKMYGAVVEKQKGRAIYEEIKSKKLDPALLEHVEGDTYQINIFPVLAKKEQRIEMAYWQVLPYDSGIVRYVYPLKKEQPVNFSFSMKIASAIPISNIFCESHKLSFQKTPHYATLGMENAQLSSKRNLGLFYILRKENMDMDFICHRNQGEDGYFLGLVTPKENKDRPVAKAMTFVLDVSGSMAGDKILQAKNALHFCIKSLRNEDFFNIVVFETSASSLSTQLMQAHRHNKQKALMFIENLQAQGATNLSEGLEYALNSAAPAQVPHLVVVLTDGEPTVGLVEPATIAKRVKELIQPQVRIFTFGIGSSIDTNLVEALARENKGTYLFLSERENLELPVSLFFQKMANPVLTNIAIDYKGSEVNNVFPRHLTELFKGTQMLVIGRYRNPGTYQVKLEGYRGKQKVEMVTSITFPEVETSNKFIARLWGSHKIDYLLYNVRQRLQEGQNQEVISEIIRLSKLWGIITPYTSYLVLETEQDYQHWGLEQKSGGNIAPKVPAPETMEQMRYESGIEHAERSRESTIRKAQSGDLTGGESTTFTVKIEFFQDKDLFENICYEIIQACQANNLIIREDKKNNNTAIFKITTAWGAISFVETITNALADYDVKVKRVSNKSITVTPR